MATTEKTTKPEAREKLTLQQKFVKLREAIPAISKKQHSDGVKYKFVKIDEIYEHLTPAMNEWGVNLDIIEESATRHYENGDARFYDSFIQRTKNGDRVVWVYEADLVLKWSNADDPADTLEVKLHALGTNDASPDKAKGSAMTYSLKYYFFEKFGIDQGSDDPDNNDYSSDAPPATYNGRQNAQRQQGGVNGQPSQQNGKNGTQNAKNSTMLSEAQMNRLYQKAAACGMSKETTNKRIREKYNQDNPAALTREQYDEICASLDASAAKKKEEQQNAE